jgi:hypothetical protein
VITEAEPGQRPFLHAAPRKRMRPRTESDLTFSSVHQLYISFSWDQPGITECVANHVVFSTTNQGEARTQVLQPKSELLLSARAWRDL